MNKPEKAVKGGVMVGVGAREPEQAPAPAATKKASGKKPKADEKE